MQSGTKLVLLLGCLAVALGVFSWWNRYELAHLTTNFWGPDGARLLVESEKVEALLLDKSEAGDSRPAASVEGYSVVSQKDLSKAPGLSHLRYALTTDSNYDWDDQPTSAPIWKWAFRFSSGEGEVLVLFNEDFDTLGKQSPESSSIAVVSTTPMAETLREYFLAKKSNLPAVPSIDASSSPE